MSRGVHIGVCPECGRTVHVMPTPINLSVADLLDQPLVLAPHARHRFLLLIAISKWVDGHHF